MDNQLKEKFEQILDKHNFVSADGAVKTHKSFIMGSFQDVYDLAKSESEASVGDGWISVEDRLPEMQDAVLAYMPKYGTPNMQVMWRLDATDGNTWFNVHWKTYQLDEVTHWMPLPQPPQQ